MFFHSKGDCKGWRTGKYTSEQCRYCKVKQNPDTFLGEELPREKWQFQRSNTHKPVTVSPAPNRPDCLELGKVLGTHNGKSCGEKVRACAVYDKCTTQKKVPLLQCCDGCDDYRAPLPHPEIITPEIQRHLEEIAGPYQDRSAEWANDPAVIEAHRIAAKRFVAQDCSDRSGRGIVLCGGGRYAPGIWLHVRLLREFGCTLPVQVWHRGSSEPLPKCIYDLADVIDAENHPRVDTWRNLGGWQMKLIAVLNCGWKEVLFSDADNYPVSDPTICFDNNPVGAVLFPDIERNDSHLDWKAYGLSTPNPNIGTNGGSSLFDLSKCGQAVQLASWFDSHSEFYYQKGYGDQDTLRAAFHLTGTPYHLYARRPIQRGPAYVQNGPTGQPLFVHRISDKPRAKKQKRYIRDLPLEKRVRELMKEYPA